MQFLFRALLLLIVIVLLIVSIPRLRRYVFDGLRRDGWQSFKKTLFTALAIYFLLSLVLCRYEFTFKILTQASCLGS